MSDAPRLDQPLVISAMRWFGDRDGRELYWCDGDGVWRMIQTEPFAETPPDAGPVNP